MDRSALALSFRCTQDWDGMTPEGEDRHCGSCDRRVVDLSARTEIAARWIVATEAPCVRYAVRPDGRVRFRPGGVARLASALAVLFPSLALAAEDEVPPSPGEVHLCSTRPTDEMFEGILVGRRGMRIPWPRLRRPHGEAVAHVAFEPGRWETVAVRCEGTPLPHRVAVEDGQAVIAGLPTDGACRARMTGDDRPLTVAFTAGNASTEIAVGSHEPTAGRTRRGPRSRPSPR